LVLCGPGDLVAVARSIHRRALGDATPFVVCDPRRREGAASVRSAGNAETGMAAMERAIGGSLCVWSRRVPRDFDGVRMALRDPAARVQLIVCAESIQPRPGHVEPITVPPLSSRPHEIARIVDEYVDDEVDATAATARLTAADRGWILQHSASSIPEIEKGAVRLLAIRRCRGNMSAAATALGMAPISLTRWIGRRALPGPASVDPWRGSTEP
jgi:hypothetical protein